MKIAIIILNYFGFQDTCNCAKSARENLDAHFFVVDNSVDPIEQRQLETEFSTSPDTSLLFTAENLGFAAGVNLGLRQATLSGYQYFLLLNNDAVLLPGAGKSIAEAVTKHPGALIAPAILWGDRISRGAYYNKFLGLITEKPCLWGYGSIYYFSGCALAFDKKFLDTAGFLDEDFFFYGEDVEYSHRAMKRNIPLVLIQEILVDHKGSGSAKKVSPFYEYHILRGHWLLTFKTIDNPILKLFAILGKLCFFFLRALVKSSRHKTLVPIISLFRAPRRLKIRPG